MSDIDRVSVDELNHDRQTSKSTQTWADKVEAYSQTMNGVLVNGNPVFGDSIIEELKHNPGFNDRIAAAVAEHLVQELDVCQLKYAAKYSFDTWASEQIDCMDFSEEDQELLMDHFISSYGVKH